MKNKIFVGAAVAIALIFGTSMVTIASDVKDLENLRQKCKTVKIKNTEQLREWRKSPYFKGVEVSVFRQVKEFLNESFEDKKFDNARWKFEGDSETEMEELRGFEPGSFREKMESEQLTKMKKHGAEFFCRWSGESPKGLFSYVIVDIYFGTNK